MKRFLLLLILALSGAAYAPAQDRQRTELSGEGWYLWQDKDAAWREESPKLTYQEALSLPQASPTAGWEVLTSSQALPVRVPGTAEEYLAVQAGPEADIVGVTWWTRRFQAPAFKKGERVVLRFGSLRTRGEVFVNRKLADYQIVANTPFVTDITDFIRPGEEVELAVRITDAGGNLDWRDSATIPWNGEMLPPDHGFGGITQRIWMEVLPAVHVSDIYMQNTPEMSVANAFISIENTTGRSQTRNVQVQVYNWRNPDEVVFTKTLSCKLQGGTNEVKVVVDPADVRLWSVDDPNLYVCQVSLASGRTVSDRTSRRFGFRWFEASGVGEDAMFRLNGKRIVLRSAISWSFWPVNGIFPSDELARRQIEIAKELGMNCLNFHRFIGYETVLDYADELGLLYYEEPGGFRINPRQDMLNKILHEKAIRMVLRDRSHPSLVIYSMMNEGGDSQPDKLELEIAAMQDMHKLDPSRITLRVSAWAKGDYIDDQTKIHLRPFDDTVYWNGWYDYHRAGGPAVWNEGLYKSPEDYYNNTQNKREIVFFGEEGAISSPPRLEKNKIELANVQYKGWDGPEFIRWYNEFDSFLDRKGLRASYPTVDDLCVAMGSVSFEHQGRKVESARMNNTTDAYVTNGWESELTENYSGIVDCFRNPKSDPKIIARYNQPLYIAVKVRQQVAEAGKPVVTDFYIINEKDVKGAHELVVSVLDVNGCRRTVGRWPVNVSGGEVYGELLLRDVAVPVSQDGGLCRIEARLFKNGSVVTEGYDDVLSVNLASNELAGQGAVYEDGSTVRRFLEGRTAEAVQPYADGLGKLDWVIVTRPPRQDQLTMVPTDALTTLDGKPGLECIYYEDMTFSKEVYREISNSVNLSAIEGATPSPHVHMVQGYGIRWIGYVNPSVTGEYTFFPSSNGRSQIELKINDETVYSSGRGQRTDGKATLQAGVPAKVEILFRHPRSNARCRLDWAVPSPDMPDPQKLMERAAQDGTRVFILQGAEDWAEYIAANSRAQFKGNFYVGTNWLGGVMFNKPHAVFNELPAGSALNWPYQALIHTGVERMGFEMEGEELLVGAYHSYPMNIGTAMGIVPVGKGSVLFSTLDIYGNIVNESAAGLVAKKLVFNMIDAK
ncbi:MAG: glycoside hydrolase family 2 [Bacteroidales bacterium]|nr:glycoside hydrolase family 2 [Bacteroidales bacterium]